MLQILKLVVCFRCLHSLYIGEQTVSNESLRRSKEEFKTIFPTNSIDRSRENSSFSTLRTDEKMNIIEIEKENNDSLIIIHNNPKNLSSITIRPVDKTIFEKNKNSTGSYKNMYCVKQIELTNKLLTCNPTDYCCIINVYENRFTYESQPCNFHTNSIVRSPENSSSSINHTFISSSGRSADETTVSAEALSKSKVNYSDSTVEKLNMCNNLNNCHNLCKQKVPMYDGCRNNNIPQYNNIVIYCFQSCFEREYNCPKAMINIDTKKMSIAEIIILVMCLTPFFYCIIRHAICNDCRFNMNQSSRESKIHADLTTVDDYSNI
jgi:hypothetical protein